MQQVSGVIVATVSEQALGRCSRVFRVIFGDAGATVVVEEFLEGQSALLALTDGTYVVPLATAQGSQARLRRR